MALIIVSISLYVVGLLSTATIAFDGRNVTATLGFGRMLLWPAYVAKFVGLALLSAINELRGAS